MSKEEIGERLKEIRKEKHIKIYELELGENAIYSIEKASRSYSVSNLIIMCNALGVKLEITDTYVGQSFPVSSISECHLVIATIMDRYEIDQKMLYRITGRYYTLPKGKKQPLSIDMLLAICNALHCEIGLLM